MGTGKRKKGAKKKGSLPAMAASDEMLMMMMMMMATMTVLTMSTAGLSTDNGHCTLHSGQNQLISRDPFIR
ncbi:hypothetical protein TYRP_018367 [Tyrophagus putrescentiae]|nr:hypothetical protein TYRP_018367 [Tyrophagus putrescentiae]